MQWLDLPTTELTSLDLNDFGLAVAGDFGAVFAEVDVHFGSDTELVGQVNSGFDSYTHAVDYGASVVSLPIVEVHAV